MKLVHGMGKLFFALFTILSILPLDAKADSGSVRIVGLTFYDEGSTTDPGLAIDTLQGTCQASSEDEPTPEPFHDTLVGITVRNESTVTVRVTSFNYTVRRAPGQRQFRSKNLAFVGDLELAPDSDKTVYGILMSGAGVQKLFPNNEAVGELGVKNMVIRMKAKVGGSSRTLSARSAVVIGNKDRCN